MTLRAVLFLAVCVLLLFGVVAGQIALEGITRSLGERTEEILGLLSDGDLSRASDCFGDLAEEFGEKKPILLILTHDGQVYGLERTLKGIRGNFARGDAASVAGELETFLGLLREMGETHRPNWENILKFHESFAIAS